MKALADADVLGQFSAAQSGVYSKVDLQTLFGEPHPAAFVRRIDVLLKHGVLRRFIRGWYVTKSFDLATLSQRIAPGSYVSFGTVLAQQGILGTRPDRQIIAVKIGRPRTYSCDGFRIDYVSVSEPLMFGFSTVEGVRYADAEKAVLDTFYFHLRGRKYPFDIYSDLALRRLDSKKLRRYLRRYRNPKFVTFAKGLLGL